jgi:hypothetical protein
VGKSKGSDTGGEVPVGGAGVHAWTTPKLLQAVAQPAVHFVEKGKEYGSFTLAVFAFLGVLVGGAVKVSSHPVTGPWMLVYS